MKRSICIAMSAAAWASAALGAGDPSPVPLDPTRPATPGRPPDGPRPPDGSRPAEAARRPSTLDELFARLSGAKDADEANGVAGLIERRFEHSGSDTADLLMTRAGLALKAEDGALAVELLDRATQLRPGWSEAWNRRAAAFFQLDDPVRAMADLQEALALEPRHFAAWTALGHLEMANGDKALALAAYRRALAIHPFLPDLRKLVDRLAPDVDGRDL